jgi:DNA repair photolyase
MRYRITEVQARSILTRQKFGSLAGYYDFSLNPYAGCAFGCSYCYVPKFPNAEHEYTEWGTWVVVKTNAPQLIARDRTLVFGSRIFFSSATDPYQYLELKYRLSRQCLQELLRYQPARLTMHTRSHLILQDLELLKAFGPVLQVGVSITTDDDDIRRQFEPGAPSIARRLALVRTLREAGVEVYASVAPLLPCNPDRLVRLLKPYVSRAWIDEMHYPEVNTRPYLLEKYVDFFQPRNYRSTIHRIASQLHIPPNPRYRAAAAAPVRQCAKAGSPTVAIQGRLF